MEFIPKFGKMAQITQATTDGGRALRQMKLAGGFAMAEDNIEHIESSEQDVSLREPMNTPAGHIKAIDRGSVHKICSGQVVLTLATAVKELVENSIDAGATSVEVKLKEYGSEMVEVADNGSGVQEANFEGLTLKHHTSKLQEFSDLPNVETFGFRGEALSSLCALSLLSVTSRHKSVGVAHKLDYDHHGRMTSKTPCARQVGTTVCLQNLFSTLPVRHKEFLRHLKKEFSRMVQILNAYCIISTGVRINCTNQCGKGKRNLVVSTNGNATLKDNIANIFGAKQLQSVLDFQQISPTDAICEELGLKIPEHFHIIYKVTGFVSSCCHGKGRSSTDRQFYFINQRPCDPTKVSKLVNEVYHTYNRHQYPFVALNINLEKEHVDVNVTPDKRQIFVQEEKLLLAIIKSSLIKLYEPIHAVYQVNAGQGKLANNNIASLSSMFKRRDSLLSDGESESELGINQKSPNTCTPQKVPIVSSLSKLKRSFSSAFAKDDTDTQAIDSTPQKPSSKQRRLDSFVSHKIPRHTVTSDSDSPRPASVSLTVEKTSPSESGFCSSQENTSVDSQTSTGSPILDDCVDEGSKPSDTFSSQETCKSDFDFNESAAEDQKTLLLETVKNHFLPDQTKDGSSFRQVDDQEVVILEEEDFARTSRDECKSDEEQGDQSSKAETAREHGLTSRIEFQSTNLEVYSQENQAGETTLSASRRKGEDDSAHSISTLSVTEMKYDDQVQIDKKQCCVNFSMEKLRQALSDKRTNQDATEFCRGFRAKISPSENQSAEEELQREIKKEMFAKMEILGQFNLGFIIARLKDDLFIIDQHATDEKYNFEMLQKNSVIQSQRMICAQNLELTASNEVILMDNLDIFKKNGFDFQIDEDAPPTQRIKLSSTPMSKNWTFGKEDIEEMLFMLSDSPGVSCRPSRVRQMFASRSCRKAIMIGTALDSAQMKTLVNHMGEIDQPWNCPHGRPTMRHLINLRMIQR